MTEYRGPERRADPALVLVEKAAAVAAQRVARIHRRRLVTHAFLAGVLAFLLVALPAAYFLDRDRVSASVERARFNCDQQTKFVDVQAHILRVGNELREKSRAVGRDPKVQRRVLRLFGPTLIKRLYAKQAALEAEAVKKWDRDLTRLRALARVDCDRVLQREGVETTPRR